MDGEQFQDDQVFGLTTGSSNPLNTVRGLAAWKMAWAVGTVDLDEIESDLVDRMKVIGKPFRPMEGFETERLEVAHDTGLVFTAGDEIDVPRGPRITHRPAGQTPRSGHTRALPGKRSRPCPGTGW